MMEWIEFKHFKDVSHPGTYFVRFERSGDVDYGFILVGYNDPIFSFVKKDTPFIKELYWSNPGFDRFTERDITHFADPEMGPISTSNSDVCNQGSVISAWHG